MARQTIYTVGGTVQAGGGIYIKRKADDELLELCRQGEFAYILSSRQIGKSSLMVRTAQQLEKENICPVTIDLSAIGVKVSQDEWYLGILNEITATLNLETDIFAWWAQYAQLGPAQRLTNFFRDVLLKEIQQQIVLFFDEIDSTLSIPFSDDFYVALRAVYNRRSTIPDFTRLSLVLVGVAAPSDLISDNRRTPFNIGHRVELDDFTPEEAHPLAMGLGEKPEQILSWVFYFTSGHPYLTQRLCDHLSKSRTEITEEAVREAVKQLFEGEQGRQDPNLQFVRDMLIERYPKLRRVLLDIYGDIRLGKRVSDDERSIPKSYLKISGIVRREHGQLVLRNRIYERIFDLLWIKDSKLPPTIYTVGGTVQAGRGIYIKRKADDELLELCRQGELAFILSSRQVGKSSLMVQTAQQLEKENIRSVKIDLSAIGVNVSLDEWYLGILSEIQNSLNLETDVFAWWAQFSPLGPAQRLTNFFKSVLLKEVSDPIVLFFDEIDSTLGIPFSDDFYVALRAVYNARSMIHEFARLSFVLLGVALPGDLISDSKRTPFNIGRPVDLNDFTLEEAMPLAQGLGGNAEQILAWILNWSGGHPYLTQRLCAFLSTMDEEVDEQAVAKVVEQLFTGADGKYDNNLQFVRDMLSARSPHANQSIKIYRNVRSGKRVVDDERSISKAHLKLSGLVRSEQGFLEVRNRIYSTVFNLHWVQENTPINTTRITAIALGFVSLVLLSILIYEFFIVRMLSVQYINSFYNAQTPSEKLEYLAKLFELGGFLPSTDYDSSARDLFFSLNKEDQEALFRRSSTTTRTRYLSSVVRGLYVTMANVEGGGGDSYALLQIMRASLIKDVDPNLYNVIDLWLQAKDALTASNLNPEQADRVALDRYNSAIRITSNNPSLYYERAKVENRLKLYKEALLDLNTTMALVPKLSAKATEGVVPAPTEMGAITGPSANEIVKQSESVPSLSQKYTSDFYSEAFIRSAVKDLLQQFIGIREARVALSESNNYSVLVSNGLIPSSTELPSFPIWTEGPTATITATLRPTATVATNQPTLTTLAVPTLGIGSTMTSREDGMVLLYIPAGEFRMGMTGQETDEKPVHTVFLNAFWIDQTEVTNSMYARCVRDGKCDLPGFSGFQDYYGNPEFDNYPVTAVSWEEANNYCTWTHRRLPTEAEWEKAARGTAQRTYPWGETINCSFANYFNGQQYCFDPKKGGPSPVGNYPKGASPYRVLDMAGNVWEWVADWYGETYYRNSPASNPTGPATGSLRVARGGSWSDIDFLARSSNRGAFDSRSNIGFRCAVSE